MKHFQHLYDVESTAGLFPKLNSIYLYVKEMKTLQKTLYQMLSLPEHSTSTQHIILSIQHLLQISSELLRKPADAQAGQAQADAQQGSSKNTTFTTDKDYDQLYESLIDMNVSKENYIEQHQAGKGKGEEEGPGTTPAAVKEEEEEEQAAATKGGISYEIPIHKTSSISLQQAGLYAKIIGQIKSLTKVEKLIDIPSVIMKLQNRLVMYDEIFPGIDRLIHSLYQILQVDHLNEIIPKIKQILPYA